MESAAASEPEPASEGLRARMDLWAAAEPGCWDEEAQSRAKEAKWKCCQQRVRYCFLICDWPVHSKHPFLPAGALQGLATSAAETSAASGFACPTDSGLPDAGCGPRQGWARVLRQRSRRCPLRVA